MSGQAFALDISRWVEKTKRNLNACCREIVLEISTRIVLRTPVDTGRARGNWQLGLNRLPTGTLEVRNASRAGSLVGEFSGLQVAGNVTYFVNNLPYIGVLEYGGYPNPPKGGEGKTVNGYSRQAPQGMVRVSVQEVSDIVRRGIEKGMKNG